MEGRGSLRERLHLCMHMEEACASAYKALAEFFSWDMRARELWDTLAFEERMHAVTLLSMGIHDMKGDLPPDLVCENVPSIREAISLAAGLRDKAIAGRLSLAEALGQAMELEKNMAEAYLFEVMKEDPDLRHLEKIKEIVSFEKTHQDAIREFTSARGMDISS
ncbi:MAG: hypothetical protein Kow0025_18790 [Thermodesulfovibrionales bacterium]